MDEAKGPSLGLRARPILGAVGAVLDALDPDTAARFVAAVRGAGRLALHGVGREGLVMRALTMRLYHAGLSAHVVGDMTTPPLGPGDLLIVSAGPGGFATVDGLLGVARRAGAATLVFTAQPQGSAARLANTLIHLPAQTMADDRARPSPLPMGSLYELALWLTADLLVEALGVPAAELRARHTNLE